MLPLSKGPAHAAFPHCMQSIKTYMGSDDSFHWNYGMALVGAGKYGAAAAALEGVQSEELRCACAVGKGSISVYVQACASVWLHAPCPRHAVPAGGLQYESRRWPTSPPWIPHCWQPPLFGTHPQGGRGFPVNAGAVFDHDRQATLILCCHVSPAWGCCWQS